MLNATAHRSNGKTKQIRIPEPKIIDRFIQGIKTALGIPGEKLTDESFHSAGYECIKDGKGRVIYPLSRHKNCVNKLKTKTRRGKFRQSRLAA